jgi:hypothetical protein
MKGLAFSTLSLLCSRTDEEAMGRVKTNMGFNHSLVHYLLRGNEPSYGRTSFPAHQEVQ